MLGKRRILLKQAQQAFAQGRLEEALAIASGPELREYRQARSLAGRIQQQLARRAEERLGRQQSQAAWQDVDRVRQDGGDPSRLGPVEEALRARATAEIRGYLEAATPEAAQARIAEMGRRRITSAELRRLSHAVQRWLSARQRAARGEWTRAVEDMQAVQSLVPGVAAAAKVLEQYQASRAAAAGLQEALHQALVGQHWSDVLRAAGELLELSPEMPEAIAARARAWAQVGIAAPGLRPAPARSPWPAPGRLQAPSGGVEPRRSAARSPKREAPPLTAVPRPVTRNALLLWIDSVGGYLVLLGDRVVVGQPVPDSGVDLPILGDLSRRHAVIIRDDESYLVRAERKVAVNGRPVPHLAPLADGDTIRLGDSVLLRFRQPTPVSSTARLEFASRHRPPLAIHGVILMADACILGPRSASHIVCPRWERSVVLYRQGDELWCRSETPVEIDGLPCEGRGPLELNSRVEGADFAFRLEPLPHGR